MASSGLSIALRIKDLSKYAFDKLGLISIIFVKIFNASSFSFFIKYRFPRKNSGSR